LPTVDLVEVIDTSGAYIPGHGTPTVTLVSRSRRPQADTIRAVLGIQGEPGAPVDPAQGLVWSSIVTHVDDAGYEDRWISVTDLPRAELGTHPWSLQGGAAGKVSGQIDTSSRCSLSEFVSRIGLYGQTNADSAFLTDQATVARFRLEADFTKQLVVGDEVRDHIISGSTFTWHPYQPPSGLMDIEHSPNWHRLIYTTRTNIANRATFNKLPYHLDGKRWHEWHMVQDPNKWTNLSIAFAFVATHNHFVLDRGGKVFKQSAPVIKLPEGASEDEHLDLLGVLNSSTACFW